MLFLPGGSPNYLLHIFQLYKGFLKATADLISELELSDKIINVVDLQIKFWMYKYIYQNI